MHEHTIALYLCSTSFPSLISMLCIYPSMGPSIHPFKSRPLLTHSHTHTHTISLPEYMPRICTYVCVCIWSCRYVYVSPECNGTQVHQKSSGRHYDCPAWSLPSVSVETLLQFFSCVLSRVQVSGDMIHTCLPLSLHAHAHSERDVYWYTCRACKFTGVSAPCCSNVVQNWTLSWFHTYVSVIMHAHKPFSRLFAEGRESNMTEASHEDDTQAGSEKALQERRRRKITSPKNGYKRFISRQLANRFFCSEMNEINFFHVRWENWFALLTWASHAISCTWRIRAVFTASNISILSLIAIPSCATGWFFCELMRDALASVFDIGTDILPLDLADNLWRALSSPHSPGAIPPVAGSCMVSARFDCSDCLRCSADDVNDVLFCSSLFESFAFWLPLLLGSRLKLPNQPCAAWAQPPMSAMASANQAAAVFPRWYFDDILGRSESESESFWSECLRLSLSPNKLSLGLSPDASPRIVVSYLFQSLLFE